MRMSAAEQSFKCKYIYLFSSLSHAYFATRKSLLYHFHNAPCAYTSSRDDSNKRDLRIIRNALSSLIDQSYANAARIARTWDKLHNLSIIIINCIDSDIKSSSIDESRNSHKSAGAEERACKMLRNAEPLPPTPLTSSDFVAGGKWCRVPFPRRGVFLIIIDALSTLENWNCYLHPSHANPAYRVLTNCC